ncbi:MAG: 3-phosphoshikimate 1-carboxyvinyltransferase [Ilumatobacteraceae bacterium]|nr:3-phosphoshikimate 1-carboxyvinyltransferase [Ilumatobacteraceae bacterium]
MTETRRVRRLDGPVEGHVSVPGSKSIANRVLVCAALADGVSSISNVPDGDDTRAMLDCLRTLGLAVDAYVDRVRITGVGTAWANVPRTLFAGLAGTTSRFITAVAALGSTPLTVDGHPPLRARPFGPLHEALGQLGVVVTPGESFGNLPATITGPPVTGRVEIRGDVSSQYVTALMLIGPELPGGLDLALTTPLVSRPYVELTASVMGWFGITDVEVAERRIRVGPAAYTPTETAVEPDASSASYPLALAAVCGGSMTVPGLGAGALQGDARFGDVMAQMGCSLDRDTDQVTVSGAGDLRGIDIDMADISDLVPTVAVVAAFASSPTRIRGVGFIREKESDRLGDLSAELRRAGVDIDETDDGLAIRPSAATLRPARLATHHDHRLAMAFGVLGSACDGIEVEDPEVVSKSWPGFWTMLDELHT